MGKVTNSPSPASIAAFRLGVVPSNDDATVARAKNSNLFRALARTVYPYALFLVVPLVVVLLFVPPPLLLVGYIGVPQLLLVRWLALSSPVPVSRVNPLLLVFALSVAWGMLHAANTNWTVVPVARLLAGVTVMYMVMDYADRPGRLWNVAAVLVLVGVSVAFIVPFVTEPAPDKLFDVSFLFRPGRLRTEEANPNEVAAALAVAVPLALALLTDPEKRFRVLGAVSLPPLLIMLTLLQARSIWGATVFGIVLFGALLKRWAIVAVPLVVLAALVYLTAAPQLGLPTVSIGPDRVIGLLQGRQQVWEFASALLVREPAGIGINTFTEYANALASDWLTDPQRDHAHNLFLQAGLDIGLIGMGAFAALFAYAFYASWHAVRHHVKRNLAVGVFVALCVAFFGGMFEVNLWENKGAVLLWALFGMAIVLGRYGARVRERTPRRRHRAETASADQARD